MDSQSCAHDRGIDTATTLGAPENSRQAAVRRYTARNALLRKQGYPSYGAYLRSQHWRDKRRAYRESDLPQTCICGEETGLQLHHITYERVGDERLSDLVPLCPSCHSLVHVLEWRGEGLGVDGLTDLERARAGREWLAALLTERQAEAAARRKAERAAVLALPFAARLQRARAAARLRHVDISHRVHLLARDVRAGKTDMQLTKSLRIVEAAAYGWEDWDPTVGEGTLKQRLAA